MTFVKMRPAARISLAAGRIVEPEGVVPSSTLSSIARKTLTRVRLLGSEILVELEGVEPSSKQGNHTLSTCLFPP